MAHLKVWYNYYLRSIDVVIMVAVSSWMSAKSKLSSFQTVSNETFKGKVIKHNSIPKYLVVIFDEITFKDHLTNVAGKLKIHGIIVVELIGIFDVELNN